MKAWRGGRLTQASDSSLSVAVTTTLLVFATIAFLADVVSCVAIRVLVNGWDSAQWTPQSFLPELIDFSDGLYDIIVLSGARLLVFPTIAVCATVFARPHNPLDESDDTSADDDDNDDDSDDDESDIQPLLVGKPKSINGDGMRMGDGHDNVDAVKASTREAEAKHERERIAEAQEDKRIASESRAEWKKTILLTTLFVFQLFFQVYVGIKVVSYHFNRDPANGNKNDLVHMLNYHTSASNMTLGHDDVGFGGGLGSGDDISLQPAPRIVWEEVLMALLVFWINLECIILKRLVESVTAKKRLSRPEIHQHPLLFSPIAGTCDICDARIKSSYACRECDFDVCKKCFLKKRVSQQEGTMRSDKGAVMDDGFTVWQYVKKTASLSRPHWLILTGAMLSLISTVVLALVLPNYQGDILQSVVDSDQAAFLLAVKIYLGTSAVTGLFGGIRSLMFNLFGRKIAYTVRNALFENVMRQDIAFFDGTRTGDVTSRLSRDTTAMVQPVQSWLSMTLRSILLLMGSVVMCFITSWRLTMLASTTILPIISIYHAYAKWSKVLNFQIFSSLGDAHHVATQALSNIRSVRALSSERIEVAKFTKASKTALDKGIKDALGGAGTFAFSNYLDLGGSVLILWFGGHEVFSGNMRVGQLITFQLYWNMINSNYQSLTNVFTSLTRSAGAASRVFQLLNAKPDIDSFGDGKCNQESNLKQSSGGAVNSDEEAVRDYGSHGHRREYKQIVEGNDRSGAQLRIANRKNLHGDFALENITFAYQMRPELDILKNVSLKLPCGKVTALVGPSGSGKSTIAHLLLRMYDPKVGNITLDRVNLRDYSLPSLHGLMGVVSQDTQLFATSIEENIKYGCPDPESITREDVIRASIQANAHSFIDSFPDKYDTKIGDRGVRLSGGQKQRVSIARAFLRRPRILLLDEATSALDTEAESEVQKAIDSLIASAGGETTVVVIAHRLSTIYNADQIAVISGGEVVELGTHDELTCNPNGVYTKLVSKQLQRSKDAISS